MNDKKNEEALIKQRHEQNLEAQKELQKEIDEATETTEEKFNLSQPKRKKTTKKEFDLIVTERNNQGSIQKVKIREI